MSTTDKRRRIEQAPGNTAFTAKVLNEHIETVFNEVIQDVAQGIDRMAASRGFDPREVRDQVARTHQSAFEIDASGEDA